MSFKDRMLQSLVIVNGTVGLVSSRKGPRDDILNFPKIPKHFLPDLTDDWLARYNKGIVRVNEAENTAGIEKDHLKLYMYILYSTLYIWRCEGVWL